MSQVTQGLATAGLVLAAGGIALGLYPVDDACGSPWSPKEGGSYGDVSTSCKMRVADRQPMSWLMTIGGAAVVVGAVVTGRQPLPDPASIPPMPPAPAGPPTAGGNGQ